MEVLSKKKDYLWSTFSVKLWNSNLQFFSHKKDSVIVEIIQSNPLCNERLFNCFCIFHVLYQTDNYSEIPKFVVYMHRLIPYMRVCLFQMINILISFATRFSLIALSYSLIKTFATILRQIEGTNFRMNSEHDIIQMNFKTRNVEHYTYLPVLKSLSLSNIIHIF